MPFFIEEYKTLILKVNRNHISPQSFVINFLIISLNLLTPTSASGLQDPVVNVSIVVTFVNDIKEETRRKEFVIH